MEALTAATISVIAVLGLAYSFGVGRGMVNRYEVAHAALGEAQAQLEALTGGAGATFMVDGFRGGRLPPRDQIRQIRFRLNSFSADNHDAGRVQVEIITRPGLAAWNGNANFGFRDNVLNARNAFSGTEMPEQLRRFTAGLRGPLVRNRTALRLNVDSNRSFDSATIVAQLPEARLTDVVRRPVDQTNVTINVEHGISNRQTLRLEYRGLKLAISVADMADGLFSITRPMFIWIYSSQVNSCCRDLPGAIVAPFKRDRKKSSKP